MNKFISLKDHVYNYISEQISSGALKPEEKINEQQLCEALNISRTPVREALIQLSTEGYIENLPRKGFIVKSIDSKKVTELYQIIGILDGLAADLSLSNITEKDINRMKYLISVMELDINNKCFDIYYEHQLEFHNVYTGLCGNSELIGLLDKLKKNFIRHKYSGTGNENLPEIIRRTNSEHTVIVGLFEKGNAEELQDYIKNVHWHASNAAFDSF